MTILQVDYTTGGDPRDNMSTDELATVRVLELDKLRRMVAAQQRGQKYSPDQPRDDHGRFGEGGGTEFQQQDAAHDQERLDAYRRLEMHGPMEPVETESGSWRLQDEGGNLLPGTYQSTGAFEQYGDRENAQATADRMNRLLGYKSKDFNEELHPRDDHGRFTDSGGGGGGGGAPTTTSAERITLPSTVSEVHSLYVKDFNAYQQELQDHGGPPANQGAQGEEIYQVMNVADGNEKQPTEEQRARCEEAAAKFLGDPDMQPLFDAYGRPGIVIATGMIGPDPGPLDNMIGNVTLPGADPLDLGVVAQWSNGTIFLYADTAGNPDTPVTPGYSTAGADPSSSLMHEYGHQIMGVIGYDADGNASDFRESFINALGDGIPLRENMTRQEQEDFQANVNMETGQVSEYATNSPDEAFAEFFNESRDPNFSIDNYDGGAAEAFRLIQDRIAADTAPKTNPDQTRLFDNRTNPEPGVGL